MILNIMEKGIKQTTLKHLCFTSAKILKVLVDFFQAKRDMTTQSDKNDRLKIMKSYSFVKITKKLFISNVSNHYFTL